MTKKKKNSAILLPFLMYRTADSKTVLEQLVTQLHCDCTSTCNTVDSRQAAQVSSVSQSVSVTWCKLKMSATEEDTELRDLLIQNLENSGVLNKIKVFFLSILKHA